VRQELRLIMQRRMHLEPRSGGTLRRLKYMLLQNMKLVLESLFMYLDARHDVRLGSKKRIMAGI
jgi:hypothetical protein